MSLTLHQRMTLAAVVAKPGQTTAELAEQVGRTPEATQWTLAKLRQRGLVRALWCGMYDRWNPSHEGRELVERQVQRAGGAS